MLLRNFFISIPVEDSIFNYFKQVTNFSPCQLIQVICEFSWCLCLFAEYRKFKTLQIKAVMFFFALKHNINVRILQHYFELIVFYIIGVYNVCSTLFLANIALLLTVIVICGIVFHREAHILL